jgi:predicted MFS family arabinose efflux permease
MKTQIPQQVWVQAIARGLYQLGSAFLIFYTPIIFVNYGNLSATEVGFAVGGGAISGFIGNILGGILTDSPRFGRKLTLLMSAGCAIASTTLAVFTDSLPFLLMVNIIFGISTGLYWTAADASVMDITTPEQRQEAFSLLGVADNLGYGIGTLSGGLLLKLLHPVELVFAAGAVAFLGLFILLAVAMQKIQPEASNTQQIQKGWQTALTDKRLMIYLLVNTLFITYMALVGGTLPLYFVNFDGTSDATVSNLFTFGYVGLGALLQVPVIKAVSKLRYITSLMISIGIWGVGFFLVWLLKYLPNSGEVYQIAIFGTFAIATIIYKPTSSAWISQLSPPSLRGVYTAIAYQCWAIGYVIGPIIGGWAIDQTPTVAGNTWLFIALSTLSGLVVLQLLNQQNSTSTEKIVTEN